MFERDIPRALEPFGQIPTALTRAHEGTGLGLPLAKNLIELHGGGFAIASKPGFGTTVTMTLPPKAAETEPFPCATSVDTRARAVVATGLVMLGMPERNPGGDCPCDQIAIAAQLDPPHRCGAGACSS